MSLVQRKFEFCKFILIINHYHQSSWYRSELLTDIIAASLTASFQKSLFMYENSSMNVIQKAKK